MSKTDPGPGFRSSFQWSVLGFCVVTTLLAVMGTSPSHALTYDPVLEWNGPTFRAVDSPQDEDTDSPAIDIPFIAPFSIATRAAADGRDVVYVVDSGNRRVQVFEANANYEYLSHSDLTHQPAGVTTLAEWDDDEINLPDWAVTATRWISPRSESVRINGTLWSWVADLSGYTAIDQVYTIDYSAAANAPAISLPSSSLTDLSQFSIQYVISDNQTGATDAYQLGDIDYGIGSGGSPVLTVIDGSSGGPSSFQTLRSAAVIQNQEVSSTDDLFVLDSADNSGGFDETLLEYMITSSGVVSFVEAYDDSLTGPFSIAVARTGVSYPATVSLSSDGGIFIQATPTIVDDNQVTGHSYSAIISGGNLTITDMTTGRILVDAAPTASVADPFLAIPGVQLRTQGSTGDAVINTTPTRPGRFLFVADTDANEIRIIPAAEGASLNGDWLPADSHSVVTLPFLNVGQTADIDYAESSPASVPADWSFRTAARPLRRSSLETITFDTDGTWNRVGSVSAAGPTDKVYEVDWDAGRITFGDDTNGAIPPANEEIYYNFDVALESVPYGTAGTGAGQFDAPEGIAARWNAALGAFDVYVADTGNDRIQKLAFYQEDFALGLEARVDYVTNWSVASGADALDETRGIAVRADGESPARIWLAIADTGNDRIVLYQDTDAALGTGGTTAPTYETEFGTSGTSVGEYQYPTGVDFLSNGTQLDVYAADASRGVITKYETAPEPTVVVSWQSSACYAPRGSYVFNFVVTNPPPGGVVDWYYDTASVFNAGTARFALPSTSISATATTATWTFADSPAGPPGDGTYYVFAQVKNVLGTVVATDATTVSETICIDDTLVPTLAMRDLLDGDTTLSFQNSTKRILRLAIAHPDSAVAVSYRASFDPTLFEVLSVSRGTAWEGIGAISVLFDWNVDNTLGVLDVSSSALGTPLGLTGNGPYWIADVEMQTRPGVLDLVTRFIDSTITLEASGSSMDNLDGGVSPDLLSETMNTRLGYLGDLATDGEGADGTVPNLAPNPDGFINFADVMTFSLAWRGSGFQQDPIADLGPVTGTPPDLVSVPDGRWDIEDVLVVTQMYSWAGAMGFTGGGAPGLLANGEHSLENGPTNSDRSNDDGPKLVLHGAAGHHSVGVSSLLQIGVNDATDIFGASLIVEYDAEEIEIIEVAPGTIFPSAEGGALFLSRTGPGWFEIAATQLTETGVTAGTLAEVTVRALRDGRPGYRIGYELRSAANETLARGLQPWGEAVQLPVRLEFTSRPNPSHGPTEFRLRLPEAGPVSLDLFDAAGRRVRSIFDQETLSPGWHTVSFDGENEGGHRLAPGIYFSRLHAAGDLIRRKLVVY